MELSSPSFKAIAVSTGLSFWFFIITITLGIFSFEIFIPFVIIIFLLMQILSKKLTKVLDVIAIYTTKIFLGIFFVTIISLYGVLFKMLKIDLLRLKNEKKTYWLEMEELNSDDQKQY